MKPSKAQANVGVLRARRRKRIGLSLLGGLACALALGACGAGQTHPNLFATDWEDDGGRSVAAIRAKIGAAAPPVGADVAVAVAGNSDKLVGIPLAGGTAWTFPHAIDVRPALAGSVVVGEGGGELFCLDAASGKKLWARPAGGMALHGAGDDGRVTVVSLGQSGQGSLLLAVNRDGSVARQIDTDKSLGVPAVLAGYAFVPWSNQYVSVLDLASGEEAGRILLRGQVSHAMALGGALYFGESALFRFDDAIKGASHDQATKLTVPQRELPGTPMLYQPGDQKLSPVAAALDKTRLYARPTSATPIGLDSDRFYGTYFRLAMAFDAKSTKLAWVHSDKNDIVGGAAGPGSLVLCDDSGAVTVLDAATGGIERELSLGGPIKSCVVQADGLAPSPPQPPAPLATQISAALTNRDAEMVAGQRLLLREMATLEDPTVTKTLVELASNPLTAPLLLTDARTAIAARRNGAQYMIEALGRHYDFLHDVLLTPPVGPMAQALAAMKSKQAAPLLATHLLDPADTDDDVKQAAAALVDIGDAGQVPQLREFFMLYRAAPDSEDLSSAVTSAGQALLVFGGPDGRKVVDGALADSLVPEALKARLSAIKQQLEAQKGPTAPKK